MFTRRHRLLIVDDTPANIRVLAEALREEYDLLFATSGAKAIEIAQGGDIELILLDVVMPELDGFRVCRILKADPRTSGVPVIFVTAREEEEEEARGFGEGGVDYITKPIRPPVVRARVRTHLELKDSRDLLEQQARALEKQNEILTENVRLKDDVERISRHDLKTPLTSIISLSQMLVEDPTVDPLHKTSLKIVEQAGYRVLNMVNRSLDLFKMEQGTYRLTPVPLDILSVVEKVVLDLRKIARQKDLECMVKTTGFADATPVVLGDEMLAYSMLANLIKNAIEASPPGGPVSIHISRDEAISVRIRNRGVVPDEIRQRFFDKYATGGKTGGTGLGTYSARLMAETQSGSIGLDSSEEGFTTVLVTLPAANGLVARTEVETTEATSVLPDPGTWPKLDLLIVDDDDDNRRILRWDLTHPKWSLEEAENGAIAVEASVRRNFDWILMDLEMPVMSGLEAAAIIREMERRRTPAHRATMVAFSSHDDRKTQADARAAGFDHYLEKPARRSRILGMLLGVDATAAPSEYGALTRDTSVNNVVLGSDLAELIPQFLENKKSDVAAMLDAVAGERLDTLRRVSHRLRGSFSLYGFGEAARLCEEIERSVQEGQHEASSRLVTDLDRYLGTVEVTYV